MTNKLKSIEIGVLTSERLRSKENGRKFLELFATTAPVLSPERFNTYEPVNRAFNAVEAIDRWGNGFLWRRSSPSISGQVVMGPKSAHDAIYVSLPPKAFDGSMIETWLSRLSEAFGVELAYLHVRTDVDSGDVEYYRQYVMPFSQGLTTHHLREGLPDLPWATVFGSPYVELFGRERLLRTPAARVEAIHGGVYVQLTDHITDVAEKRDVYLTAQREAKAYLDHDAFRGMSESGKYRVPEFSLVTH